ncbi:MAG: HlyD family type I secretion periplasmic adaptor subunit [Burkholderiales bacterium]|jgi:adhesin transport system membrane fusion protein|nr:HlyD family type I secretion periplasmic adaptor subunit [Burkholderiales bacterium]
MTTAQPSTVPVDLLLSYFDNTLGQTRRLRRPRALIYAVAAVVAAMLLWTTVAQVDLVVHTQGRIVPSGKQQLVQHLEGGILSKLFVHEGDAVAAGQPLVAVSDLQANSSRAEKGARQAGMAARVARLDAEANGAPRFQPPAGTALTDPTVQAEAEAFAARAAKLAQTTRVLQEQATQRRQEAAEAAARTKGLRAELEVARSQLSLVQNMVARNAGSQSELLDARGRVERLTTQIAETEASLPRLAAAAGELSARQAETVAQFRSEARTALSDARVELRRLEEDIKTENDRVRRTVLTAPVAGIVNKLASNTVGGVVKPGETLLELTPQDDALVIETRASPAERGTLRVGLPTRVKVAAFDYTTYGTLEARVSEISADSLVDERGERYFRVVATVDPASAKRFGQSLGPGMSVSADVVTGRRTVLQYLLSPIRGLADTALRDRK